jgi:hypothetical protein
MVVRALKLKVSPREKARERRERDERRDDEKVGKADDVRDGEKEAKRDGERKRERLRGREIVQEEEERAQEFLKR